VRSPTGPLVTPTMGFYFDVWVRDQLPVLFTIPQKNVVFEDVSLGLTTMVDLGEVDLSPGLKRNQSLAFLRLRLFYTLISSVVPEVYITKIIFIPCDEWSFDWTSPQADLLISSSETVVVDSSLPPEHVVQVQSNDQYISNLVPNMVTPPQLSSNSTQRLWMISLYDVSDELYVFFDDMTKVTINSVARYLVPRGAQ
jgi:hypothetical protein